MNKWVNRKLAEKKRDGKGFTLVELLVVTTILGILAAIVFFKLTGGAGSANFKAVATTVQTINTAEQAYCLQHGNYGLLTDLVSAGFLDSSPPPVNPAHPLVVNVNTIPASASKYAQLVNGCGTSVYDVYPQLMTQPNGSQVVINTPPQKVVVVDDAGPAFEEVAALGVLPFAGIIYAQGGNQTSTGNTGVDLNTHGKFGVSPLLNTASPYQTVIKKPNMVGPAIQGWAPDLIVGDTNFTNSSYQVYAPYLGISHTVVNAGAQQVNGLSLLPWLNSFLTLATILNRQAQAAQFLAAFDGAAAGAAATLQGSTVSIIDNTSTSPTNSATVSVVSENPITAGSPGPPGSQGTSGVGSTLYAPFLQYLGISVRASCATATCAPYSWGGGGGTPTFGNLAGNPSWVPGKYLIAVVDTSTPLAATQSLFNSGGLLVGLPQVTCNGQGGSCVLVGDSPTFGNVSQIGGSMNAGSTLATLPPSLTGTGTTTYCTSAGVPILAGLSCSGSTVTGYTPQTLTNGIWPDGPISQLAAIPWIAQNLHA